MSVDVSGPASALARIGAIQSRFAAMAAPAARSSSSGATSAAGASAAGSLSPSPGADGTATSFDSVLGDALTRAVATAGAAAGDPSGDGGSVGERAVAAGRRYLGVPYVWGGTDPATGLDCSGLVQRAFADVGVKLPRVATHTSSPFQ